MISKTSIATAFIACVVSMATAHVYYIATGKSNEPEINISQSNPKIQASRAGFEIKSLPATHAATPRDAESDSVYVKEGIEEAEGLLNVNINKRSILSTLEEISRLTNIPIHMNDNELVQHEISMIFKELDIETAIRRIAQPFDALFLYSGEELNARLKAIWVFPDNTGHSTAAGVIQEIQSNSPQSQVAYNTPGDKAAEVESAVLTQGQASVELVTKAVQDNDEIVRGRALISALNNDVKLAPSVLTELVQSDASPVVRAVALAALANDDTLPPDELESIAETATNDSDSTVRAQAKGILSQLQQNRYRDDAMNAQGNGGEPVY
jgi:hypothetical protein